MHPIKKIITDAYNIIKNPNKWCQDFYFLDDRGLACERDNADKYCALGAVQAVSAEDEMICCARGLLQNVTLELFPGYLIQCLNDYGEKHKAHQDVLTVFEHILTLSDEELLSYLKSI